LALQFIFNQGEMRCELSGQFRLCPSGTEEVVEPEKKAPEKSHG
jgi:hypothetical protein